MYENKLSYLVEEKGFKMEKLRNFKKCNQKKITPKINYEMSFYLSEKDKIEIYLHSENGENLLFNKNGVFITNHDLSRMEYIPKRKFKKISWNKRGDLYNTKYDIKGNLIDKNHKEYKLYIPIDVYIQTHDSDQDICFTYFPSDFRNLAFIRFLLNEII